MYFSIECVIHDLRITYPEDGVIELEAGGEHNVCLRFREMLPAQRRPEDDIRSAFCRATGTWTPDTDILSAFQDIANEWRHQAADEADSVVIPSQTNAAGEIIHYTHMGLFQPGISEFRNDAFQLLLQSVRRGTQLLRWRAGLTGPHNPIRLRGERDGWSLDGKQWFPLATLIMDLGELVESIEITNDMAKEVSRLLQSEADEPLAHQLFREAWEQRHENPRSALVIGIAAAEAGVKHYITSVAPQTMWLVENLQSPPLLTLITRYLPTLFPPTDDGAIWKLAKKAHKPIQDGVEARNKIVHLGAVPSTKEKILRRDELTNVLLSVLDLLWLLDYQRGENWALERIRPGSISKA